MVGKMDDWDDEAETIIMLMAYRIVPMLSHATEQYTLTTIIYKVNTLNKRAMSTWMKKNSELCYQQAEWKQAQWTLVSEADEELNAGI